MDLYSNVRAISRPFRFRAGTRIELPLSAHGLIGNGLTAAMVRVDGAITWACFPRFDSPSVFGALLDEDAGGCMRIAPTSGAFASYQGYEADSNVLDTVFEIDGGDVVSVTDSMPWSDDPRADVLQIHRRISCIAGSPSVTITFDPRFDYGRAAARFHVDERGILAEAEDGQNIGLSVGRRLQWTPAPGGGMQAELQLKPGERVWCVLAWDEGSIEPVEAFRPSEHLRETRRSWHRWCQSFEYDGLWRHHVLRAALTLKMLIYAPTGAMVAAPTTSLPEWIGGPRNWDYRYVWARDAAMAVRATNLVGFRKEATAFQHFLRDVIDKDHSLAIMWTVDGQPVPAEQTLDHLTGHRRSSPVRIGNGARDQVQLDTTGAVVDAVQLFEAFGGVSSLDAWRQFQKIVEVARQNWCEKDNGIWEPRAPMAHNVHSKLLNWLAMDRASQVAGFFQNHEMRQRWSSEARRIHADILANGMDAKGEHFVSAYGRETPDAALLQLALHGFLPDNDPRMRKTVDWIMAELGEGPFLHRYKVSSSDDGINTKEGAFVLCGFWLAEALALRGDVDHARDVFNSHLDAANHLGLIAEEIDPSSKEALGNFPQAFSHMGLINAALRIDYAIRLRDEGRGGSPHLVSAMRRVY